tara:strand:+ start:921 stop:2714 length:1794 start_codon:yes stop_codon:yes gene_type:complete
MADDGRKGTFGRGLQKFIQNNLPYRSPAAIIDDVTEENPKFKDFYKAGSLRKELLAQHSILAPKAPESSHPVGSFLADRMYNELMYATLDVDKYRRLRDYRTMAQFAEVADALDEICDDFLNEDEHGNIINLELRDVVDFDPLVKKQLNDEFGKFINLFDIKERGWEYVRSMLVDGELYFENIIHEKHIKEGILGVINVPTQAIDPVYDNYQNMHIKAYLLRKAKHHKDAEEQFNSHGDKDFIPMEKNQITYINSGTWNENKTFRIPFIENARRAYRQLSLIEDSIIIYRLVRAPERLVFNVDVGNMSAPKAEGYIRRLMQNYWSKKTFSLDDNKRVDSFNPQSILDAYWFPKREGSNGTEVKTLPGGQNLGELDDLKYFVKKLYKALKVPTNRVESETSQYSADATVLREELKFANFIVRLQHQFAIGLKDAFITHLKLKHIWKDFDLRENIFDLTFTPPRNYFELRRQQIMDLKLNNFTNVVANESISQGFGQKEYLGWTDEQIKANREWLRKDAALQFELDQIRGGGPDWAVGSGPAPAAGGAPMPAPGAPGAPGPGDDIPPEIGTGAPAAGGGDTEAPTPEPTAGGETSALPT